MIIPDYHIHTNRCGHARGQMQEYVEEARNKGCKEIGFSDHLPMYWLPSNFRDPGLAMQESDFPVYIKNVLDLGRTTQSLSIRLGVEVDYVSGWDKNVSQIISSHPFDYVIGSIHFIEGWAFDNPHRLAEYNHRNLEEVYEKYFNLLCEAAASGLFDIIAHPDLIKKFGFRLTNPPLRLYRQAAVAFAKAGVCVEVNTAGLRVSAKEIYPSHEFLRMCRIEGVPVVTGSDAHDPGLVGAGFDEALLLLKEAGYHEVTFFKERQRQVVKF